RLQESKTADDALNALLQDDTRGTLCAFNNIKRGLEWHFREPSYPQYTTPAGLRYEFDAYPEIYAWQQRHFCEHPPPPVDTNPDVNAGTASSESLSIHSGDSGSVEWPSSVTEGTSIDCLFGDDWSVSRYSPLPPPFGVKLKDGQHRVRSLVIIGPSKLGKSLVARSFGTHNYFQGEWNIEQFNPDATYNVFDDIEKGLDGFNFRAFLGCQSDVNVADKYHKKTQIKNGKPCIYLHNIDPLETKTGQKFAEWLTANCTFVYVSSPICNFARLALEQDIANLLHVVPLAPFPGAPSSKCGASGSVLQPIANIHVVTRRFRPGPMHKGASGAPDNLFLGEDFSMDVDSSHTFDRSERDVNTPTASEASRDVAPFGNQKFVDTKRNSQYVLRAKYILLTYSQVDEDVFHPQAIVNLINNWGGKCRIGREFHQDGGIHYHAFCMKDARFITRDKRKFDIAGFHPNITPVMRTPHRAWAYAIKDGNVIHDDIPDAPVGRSGKAKKPRNEVWTLRLQESKTADDALNALLQDDTRGTL
ncbi:hypothetical protein SLEP1_g60305, partial [Rubroshorea leprosula]